MNLLSIKQHLRVEISDCSLRGLGFRRQLMRLNCIGGKDVLDGMSIRQEMITHQPAIAAPEDTFGTHDRRPFSCRDFRELADFSAKSFRVHVIMHHSESFHSAAPG